LIKKKDITQREISEFIGVAVSMINKYLESYEKEGQITRKYHSKKTVEYLITKKGIERRKLLNIWYLQSFHGVYVSAKNNIESFLNQIIDKGFKNILLYGAGDVAEIMLQSMNDNNGFPLKVFAVIDDDVNRQGLLIVNVPIISLDLIDNYEIDGILVSSYKHHDVINENLNVVGYPTEKIINFFD
jgi:FlaA1/EpsC-like NDP-sugar epimerase